MNNIEDKCNLHAGGKTEMNFGKLSMTKIANCEHHVRFTIDWIAVRMGFDIRTNISVFMR